MGKTGWINTTVATPICCSHCLVAISTLTCQIRKWISIWENRMIAYLGSHWPPKFYEIWRHEIWAWLSRTNLAIKLGLNCRETQHVKAAVFKSFCSSIFWKGFPFNDNIIVVNEWLNHRFDCFLFGVWWFSTRPVPLFPLIFFRKLCVTKPSLPKGTRCTRVLVRCLWWFGGGFSKIWLPQWACYGLPV